MKIAIDLDNTMFDCDSLIYQVITSTMSAQNINKPLKYTVLNPNEEMPKGIVKSFGRMSDIDHHTEIQNATSIIKSWKEAGSEIILLSSRPKFVAIRKMLLALFEKFDIDFNFIVIACNNKAKFCDKFNINLIIDDSFQNCKNCEIMGTKSIWFNRNATPIQKNRLRNQGYLVASTWDEMDYMVREEDLTITSTNENNELAVKAM